MLFVSSLCLAKLAIPVGLWPVSPVKQHQIANIAIGIITIIWAVTSILGFAFQCNLPYPWGFQNWHCMDRVRVTVQARVLRVINSLILVDFSLSIRWCRQYSHGCGANRLTHCYCCSFTYAPAKAAINPSAIQFSHMCYCCDNCTIDLSTTALLA